MVGDKIMLSEIFGIKIIFSENFSNFYSKQNEYYKIQGMN